MQTTLNQLLIIVLLGSALSGCKTTTEKAPGRSSSAQPNRLRNGTYSLLYEVLSKDRNINKLLIVKKERPAVGELVVEIAQTAADAADDLEEWANLDHGLRIKEKNLPESEVKAREAIGSKRGKQLLFSTGEKFELNLLLSQAEALSYGAQLAQLAASQDDILNRRMRMEELSRKLESLHEKVLALLIIRPRSK